MNQVEQFFKEKYLVASASTKAQTVHSHLHDKKDVKNVIRSGRQKILEPALLVPIPQTYFYAPRPGPDLWKSDRGGWPGVSARQKWNTQIYLNICSCKIMNS
jgi:hypothetical protein